MDYKDIEKINTEFNDQMPQEEVTKKNKMIEKLKEELKTIEEQLNGNDSTKGLIQRRNNLESVKTDEEKAGNTAAVTSLQSQIDAINNEITAKEKMKAIKIKKLDTLEKKVNDSKAKVDACIEELSRDPEFKRHIDAAMKKRLVRRSEKALKENEMLKNLQELIKLQPECGNNVAKMKDAQTILDGANVKIEKLSKDIEGLDPVADAAIIAKKQAEISNEQLKIDKNRKVLNTNKTEIKKAAKKHKLELDEEILKKFVKETTFPVDKNTKKVVIESVARTVNRKMKGNEKTLLNNQIALSKLEKNVMYTDLEDRTDEDGNVKPLSKTNMEIKQKSFAPVPVTEKPKWYQFRKRFQNWRQNRKAQKENETTPPYTRKEYEQEVEEKAEPNNFKSSLRYEVVQEYARRREHEVLKDAKDTIKDLDDGSRN